MQNKRKILLINPPNLEEEKVEAEPIPLGLQYIAEFLEINSIAVNIANFYFLNNWNEVVETLSNYSFDFVGIPCYTRQRFSVLKLCEVCKKLNPKSIIVLGGPHASFLDINILEDNKSVDYIVRGEGELTVLYLIKYLNNLGGDEESIYGLSFRNSKGKVIRNPDRPLANSLDAFPSPKHTKEQLSYLPKCSSLNFHFLPLSVKPDKPIGPILFSRGCNNKCAFCCNGSFWQYQRYHSVGYVLNAIEYLYRSHGINLFDFYDDSMTSSNSHVQQLCKSIIERKLQIFWWCSSRADCLSNSLLKEMKDAGCFMVSYGLESGSQMVLDKLNKKLSLDRFIETANNTKQRGLKLRVTLSVGNLGEDNLSILSTIDFLNKIKPDQVGLFLVKLYPGTPLYKKAVMLNIIDDNYWSKKDSPIVPFNNIEHTTEELLYYRDQIVSSLSKNSRSIQFNSCHNVEMDLDWTSS